MRSRPPRPRTEVAADVRIVSLPGLTGAEDNKDVSDWLDKHGDTTAEDFTEMCLREPLWTPGAGANDADDDDDGDGITIEDFYAYLPQHCYLFVPTRELWPASSVDTMVPPVDVGEEKPVRASRWLDSNRAVVQMTWAPGLPLEIHDRIINDGGWVERTGVTTLNLYRGPTLTLGNAAAAERWVAHVRRVYPNEAEHILDWLAHRVQRPQDKINHALVLGGIQGIGKDTLLGPVKNAVGPWNFIEVSPQNMLGRFNGFSKSVILRINEAHDLGGEVSKYAFYERLKSYTAAPPEALRVDEKNLREYSIQNSVGVIITTNHKTGGIYLPTDDRRHFVAWSSLTAVEDKDYWLGLWDWYAQGGDRDVAAFLMQRDLSAFNAKAPPAKTPAFWDIVAADAAPEDAELADALDTISSKEGLGRDAAGNAVWPRATTLDAVRRAGSQEFSDWAGDRKSRRVMPHRFEKCGYSPIRNADAVDGLWRINGRRQVVYVRNDLSAADKLRATRALAGEPPPPQLRLVP